ncbi:cytochrome C552 [Stappia sp. GBMRC 2046]|uniref:Cytochrome C552 n=1 Tax=Stappia sediminis TaxID=2692190 RepID=A0A7X3S7P4_9HYPH|nr:cytochrome C552 [Stappia sediminis]
MLPASITNVQAAGDPADGERLARQWCAACHVVADDQTNGTEAVPSFTEIAKTRGFNEATLTGFLADPHPKMPDMSLTNREISNLASYILSRGN